VKKEEEKKSGRPMVEIESIVMLIRVFYASSSLPPHCVYFIEVHAIIVSTVRKQAFSRTAAK
jgi:hypothetical protein